MSNKNFQDKLIALEQDLRHFALKYTQDPDTINDLVQETFFKALTNSEKFKDETNFKAWLFTILKNSFINHYRKQARFVKGDDEVKLSDSIMFSHNKIAEISESILRMKEIKKHINRLDSKIRSPFKLYINGLKYKEISDILEIPIGTVKSRIFMARKILEPQIEI
jgi:RNA polymerase sigma-70 factor (ECF subfamily)